MMMMITVVIFIQTKGCAEGTVASPLYTTTYMNTLENTLSYPEIKNDCLFYEKYIDDIFIMQIRGEAKLNNFLTNHSMKHDSMKFLSQKVHTFNPTFLIL